MMRKLCVIFIILLSFLGCSKKETKSADTLTPLSLQLKGGIEAESAGFYAAVNKGFYLDEGLDVTLIPGDWLTRPEDSVLSGSATFGVTWLPHLLVLHDQGKPLVQLAQLFQKSGTRLVTKKSLGIIHPVDMIHHHAILWPEGYGYEFFTYLGENGVSPQFIQIGEDKAPLRLLKDNQADIVSCLSYKDFKDISKDSANLSDYVVFDGSRESWGMPQDCIITLTKAAQEKKDLSIRFIRASLKGWDYVLSNPKESAMLLKDFDKTNQLDVENELNSIREIGKLAGSINGANKKMGALSDEDFNRTVQLMTKYRILKNPVDKKTVCFDLGKF